MTTQVQPSPPASSSRSASKRRGLRWLLFLTLATCLWVLLFKGCAHFTMVDEEPTPEWTSSQSSTPPEDFRFLSFPVSTAIDVYDAPGGSVSGQLSRAVAMSVDEERGEWVRAAGAGYVRRSDLTVAPPVDAEKLVDAYEAAMKAHMGIEFVWAGLKEGAGADGLQQITFRESFDDYAHLSTYRVAGTTGVPLEFARDGIGNALGQGFESGRRALISMPITLLVGCVLTWVLKRRIVPRQTAAGAAPAPTGSAVTPA